MNIPTVDLAIVLAYIVGVVLFGLWIGRRQKNATDYMVGGRDAPMWAVLFSILATETSTVTFLSIPGVAFGGDAVTWLVLPLGYIVGRLVVVGVLLPLYFEGKLFTAYQVLDQRFGGAIKTLASALFIVTRTLADGLRLYLTAFVLQEVADIPLAPAVVILGVATIVYTFFGGMKAVLWTDVLQFFVYMLGAGIAFALLLDEIGGFDVLRQSLDTRSPFTGFTSGLDFTSTQNLWAGLVGGAFLSLGTHGVDQLMVQRYLSAKNSKQAGLALGLSGPLVALQMAFFLLIGLGLFVYFQQNPPAPAKSDRVFASFIVDTMPIGVLGLVLGAVFSAAMSTLSSSLNSCATTTVTDLLGRRDASGQLTGSDTGRLRSTRILTVVFGLLQIAVAIGGQYTHGNVIGNIFKVAGYTTGIVLGVFFLGVLCRRADQRAALIAMILGLAGMTAIAFGTAIAWPWFALIGSVGTLGIGWLTSVLRPSAPAPS